MELFVLDAVYQPGPTVRLKPEDTMVWTERYQGGGDFQVTVENDIQILAKLPIGALISHTETLEVMIIENHELSRNSDRKLTATISGRSFETFAENRVTLGSESALYTIGGAAITEVTGTLAPETVARDLLRSRMMPTYASADDSVPNISIYTSVVSPDPAMAYNIERGDVYSVVMNLLSIAKAGIRNKRPKGAQTTLDIVIHDGLDLSSNVIFYAQRGDLTDTTYFWSIKGYKNYAQVATHTDKRLYRHKDLSVAATGFARRIMYVDANDLEGSYTPGSSIDVLASRAQGALDENRAQTLMTAKVTNTATPKFKIHYDIGDRVTAFGEFSISQVMRVTEHILTVDKNGTRGYPSLAAA